MDFENKICGICNKSRLHAFKEQVSPGVYVDAYKCGYGHISYTREVMQKIEALIKAAQVNPTAMRPSST